MGKRYVKALGGSARTINLAREAYQQGGLPLGGRIA